MLKSRIFSLTADLIFQFFVGEAWGERRILFWKFKENLNFVFSVIFYVFSQNQLVNINDDIDVKNVYLSAKRALRRATFCEEMQQLL